jgi:predicted DsbA family dithiol-disulfide isomerase
MMIRSTALLATFVLTGLAQSGTSLMTVVATVNGAQIYEADLQIQTQLAQVQRQEYDLRIAAVRRAISQKVLALAAKEKGMTAEQFVVEEVDKTIPEPSEPELRAFYLAQKDQLGQPFEKAREQLRKAFREATTQLRRQSLADELLARAEVRIFVRPPRLKLDFGDAPRKGSSNAPVTIVEFSDFECPYCKRVQPTLKTIAEKYGDRVAFVYKDFPLPELHHDAQAAAEASHCAEEQDKFWAYHDALFTASPAFDKETFVQLADGVGLNRKAFEACVESGRHQERVMRDLALGRSLGVIATPTFFVNGVNLSGPGSASEFEKIIDAELALLKQQ